MSILAFDLDDTLCIRSSDQGAVEKYKTCKPIPEMVKIVNDCYDKGHEIVIYTARGMTGFSGNKDDIIHNLYNLTRTHLEEWGVKYHQLVMGKLHYHLLIDDKAINSRDVKSVEDIEAQL